MRNMLYAEICRCVGFFFLILSLFGVANAFAPFKIVPPFLLLFFIIAAVLCGILEFVFEKAAAKQKQLPFAEQTLKQIRKKTDRVYLTW